MHPHLNDSSSFLPRKESTRRAILSRPGKVLDLGKGVVQNPRGVMRVRARSCEGTPFLSKILLRPPLHLTRSRSRKHTARRKPFQKEQATPSVKIIGEGVPQGKPGGRSRPLPHIPHPASFPHPHTRSPARLACRSPAGTALWPVIFSLGNGIFGPVRGENGRIPKPICRFSRNYCRPDPREGLSEAKMGSVGPGSETPAWHVVIVLGLPPLRRIRRATV
jgi:hypothetical protein